MGDPVIVTVPRGLQTEQGRIAGGEPVLIDAENVVCRRPGLVEPRGQLLSYVRATATAATNEGTCVHTRRWTNPATPTQPALYYFTGEASDRFLTRLTAGGSINTGIITSGRVQEPRSADLGDRLAWCMDMGIGMVDDAFGLACFRPPGVPQGPAPTVRGIYTGTPAEEWFPTTGAVAYRTCVVRIINGIPVRGAPSPRVIHRQDTAGTAYIELTIPLDDLTYTGLEQLEIYRTQVTTVAGADPGDEMRLRMTVPIASYAPLGVINDYLPDDAWNGAFLYTNETVEGLAQANQRPNMAADVALYNGMTCYAQAETWPMLFATLRTSGDCAVPSESMVSVCFDGTTTALSPTITGVTAAAFPYLAVGQLVTGTNIPAGAKIQSFNAGAQTITLDDDATGNGAVVLLAWDWFCLTTSVGTERYMYAYPTVNVSGAGTIPTFDTYLGAPVFYPNADQAVAPFWSGGAGEIARCWDRYYLAAYSTTTAVDSQVQLRIDAYDIGPQDVTQTNARGMALRFFIDCDDWDAAFPSNGTSYGIPPQITFDFRTTKPAAWDTERALTSVTDRLDSTTLGGANRIAVSKVDQPESVPLANFFDIGGSDYPIRRIVATTDSLWILKGDGLWRMYGDDPASMAVQQVDPTCRMFGRDTTRFDRWVTKMGDTVFAWTDLGIVAINASGVQRIDDPIRTLVRKYTPSNGQNVYYPWAWSSLSTGTVAIGFDAHEYRDDPLGFVYDVPSGTWSTMSTTNVPAVQSDVVTVNDGEPVTVGGEAVTI